MPALGQRMRKLQAKLLSIRLGSGAYVLPQDVKRIHMRFAKRLEGGHMGPRKFWQHELVRVKYHNPAVSMTVDRTAASSDPATMSIHFTSANSPQSSASASASGPAPAPAPVDATTPGTKPPDSAPVLRIQEIDMKHRTNSEILREFVRVTNARAVEPTQEEEEELQQLEEARQRGERDRVRQAEVRARIQREKDLLEQARGDVAANAA